MPRFPEEGRLSDAASRVLQLSLPAEASRAGAALSAGKHFGTEDWQQHV